VTVTVTAFARSALLLGLVGLAAAAPACRRGGGDDGKGKDKAEGDQTSFLTNFAPLKLVDQDDNPFVIDSLRGKVVLFNFIFTSCPNICPVQTQALAEVQRKIPPEHRDRVQFVSVSIDPEHDRPAVLRSFASRFRVDFSRWTFVTGGTADIDRLADRLRLFAENKERLPENHGTTLWLMDGQGRLMQRYAGNPPEVSRLVDELHSLVKLAK
jgi:protein SCO1